MNPSRSFILRPVATSLLMVAILLVGLIAYKILPVSALPEVEYPTIQILTRYPGASPEVTTSAITAPLERQFGQMPGLKRMSSTSGEGISVITLQFDLSLAMDVAEQQVQASIANANSFLPQDLPMPPVYSKVNPADAPILTLAVSSSSLPLAKLADLVDTRVAMKISQLPGIGLVTIGGGLRPAVRVQVNPQALASAGLSLEDVRSAIANANVNMAKGSFDGPVRATTLDSNDQLKSADDYRNLTIAWKNGAPIRLSDVAEAVEGAENTRLAAWADRSPAVIINIQRQPGANVIETAERVRALLPQLEADLPTSVDLRLLTDRTTSIRASVHDVQFELALAVALVVGVIYLFLRSLPATVIPAVAVPLSLVGTFAVMYAAGFSINNLTLMALTIATGFVVDDAIVMIENISRHVEEGETPLEAALKGARQIGFTIISLTVSLIAVLIPLIFMADVVGRLFREFAITLAVSILISAVVSLTLTPMMCARLLRAHPKPAPDARPGVGSRLMDGVLRGYGRSLRVVLDHPWITLAVLVGTMAFNVYLYGVVPKGFFPQQDTGRIMGFIDADQRTSFQSMRGKLEHFTDIVGRDPAVANVVGYAGGSGGPRGGGGMMFVTLKPLAERKASADEVIARLRGKLGHVPGASLFLVAAQDIRMGGRMSNAQYEFTLQADSLKDLKTWEPRIRDAMRKLPQLEDVNSDRQDKGEQTFLSIDRDALARLGLNQRLVNATLNDLFGQRLVSTIYGPLNQYRVVLEAPPAYLQGPEVLNDLFFVSPAGARVPLAAFARWDAGPTPLAVNHQGGSVATTISFNLPLGTSLSEATDAVRQEMARIGVPTSVHGSFQGNAKAFQASLQSQPLLILAAIVAVYLILGILYESLIHPLTILSTLPSAGVGAILALLLFKTEFGIIALIGVILLIGIVKKNAIMMVDFAIDAERSRGLSPREAIFEACQLRFRPIMMTTLAALFGALPLAFGVGDGAEMRQPLGITIVGGLILSQLLTLYTTPVVFLQLDRLRRAAGRWRAARLATARP